MSVAANFKSGTSNSRNVVNEDQCENSGGKSFFDNSIFNRLFTQISIQKFGESICLLQFWYLSILNTKIVKLLWHTMKIICEISVHNRLAPHVKSRSQQSTLALGYHPPNTKDVSNLFIIHFSATNKMGTRYKIKRNIEKIFTKFVNDGKTTISFTQPTHDLMIRCDPIQLKCFLKTFKLAMEGKADAIGLSSLAVTPVPQKSMPAKKLTIQSASDYPLKGLPMCLVELNVSPSIAHCWPKS